MKQLSTIQQALKAPKSQRNTFGNYDYRSCEDILEAVKPLLLKNKVILTLTDEMIEVGGRVYVKATACLFSTEEGGGRIEITGNARETETKKGMDAAQITGAASSYARKYALNGMFCIDDTGELDSQNNGEDEYKFDAEKTIVRIKSQLRGCRNKEDIEELSKNETPAMLQLDPESQEYFRKEFESRRLDFTA